MIKNNIGDKSKKKNNNWDKKRISSKVKNFDYDLLRKLRLEKGILSSRMVWTQKAVSRRLKISLITYIRLENGIREPELKTLIAIYNLFKVDFKQLLKIKEEVRNDNCQ